LTNGSMDSVQSTGFTVVSIICDKAPTTVAVINRIYRETNEKYTKEGKENKVYGFKIENQEIIPLYDVPHLLKGLRNNLVSKDLHYMNDNKKRSSSWKDIEQFYELSNIKVLKYFVNAFSKMFSSLYF